MRELMEKELTRLWYKLGQLDPTTENYAKVRAEIERLQALLHKCDSAAQDINDRDRELDQKGAEIEIDRMKVINETMKIQNQAKADEAKAANEAKKIDADREKANIDAAFTVMKMQEQAKADSRKLDMEQQKIDNEKEAEQRKNDNEERRIEVEGEVMKQREHKTAQEARAARRHDIFRAGVILLAIGYTARCQNTGMIFDKTLTGFWKNLMI